jgi:hypothetical protein
MSSRGGGDAPASDDRSDWWSNDGRSAVTSWLISFVVHFAVLISLGLVICGARPGFAPLGLVAYTATKDAGPSNVAQQPWTVEQDLRGGGAAPTDIATASMPVDVPIEAPQPTVARESLDAARVARSVAATAVPEQAAESRPPAEMTTGGGLEGRRGDARSTLAGEGGGNRQSEEAVEQGLRWLAAHQRDDGSWGFNLNQPPCSGLCRNSGTEASTTASTALALLPFLGAGYTHTEGEHAETVKRGLYYLGTRARTTPQGVDLQDGTMYGQGLATIALCEAYAMTHDEALKDVAQQAIRFIVFAQNTAGGGWRYTPGAPGDVTVTGWQLMALKSGQLAKLDVPSPTVGLAQNFLDSVQTDGGARYNYMVAQPARQTNTTTAVGLLCRMYTGWHRDTPALYQGVAYLHKWGPDKNNMYYNYYATQVLHHWEGPEWQEWNGRMRDYLIATQSKTSHEAGSWHFPDAYGDVGGRLYNTALAIMTLEVYYRYMPLYRNEAVQRRF